jgi:hypothetical protein
MNNMGGDNADEAAPNRPACVVCSKPLVENGEYCPYCGAEAVSSSSASAIDAYLRKKVDLELSGRLKDQNSLVRELGDKAEDILWNRFKRYSVILGALVAVLLGAIAFVGIKSLNDISARIEPIVHDAEERAKAAKQTIELTAARVDSVKTSLDQLSRDAEAQTERVAESSGEISHKLGSLEAAANDAQRKGEGYQLHAEELSSKLVAMEKSLQSRVQTVSKQVDDVSIQQVYPTLGQQKYVTLQGRQWKGKIDKQPNEKWINIYIQPQSMEDVSQDQLKTLMEELKTHGYTPLLGMIGIGGPYSTGFGPLGIVGADSKVFYFRNEAEDMAEEVRALASKILTLKIDPLFVDSSKSGDAVKFVIDNSGVDLQLYIVAQH